MEAHSFARSDGGLTFPRSRRLLSALGDERLVAQLRKGNDVAFEILYDRYQAAVLSYCRHMLGSRDEAEDALQQAFVSAHADIVSTDKPIRFKAWIYTIARNRCLSILRARREQPTEDLDRVSTAGLSEEVQHRAELRDLLGDMRELPDDQRTALILSELGDLSHADVAEVIGCEVAKVKSLVFQARSGLLERREARETPCQEIREQLSTLRGGSLRRGLLRRHLKACPGCTEFRDEVRRQRQMVAAVLPVVPTLALRDNALAAVGISASSAGTGLLAAGGGGAVIAAKAGVAKMAVVAVATTGTVGGAVAVDQGVVGGHSDRSATQSKDAGAGAASGQADAAERTGAAGDTEDSASKDGAAEGKAHGKGGVGAEHKRGFNPIQGEANGERARDFASGRGNRQDGVRNQTARGGSIGKAHRRQPPKRTTTPAPQRTEAPGPRNGEARPTPQNDLKPLVPVTPAPDFRPQPPEREERVKPENDAPPPDDGSPLF